MADDPEKKPAPETKKDEAPKPEAPVTPPSEQKKITPEATAAAPGAAVGPQPAMKPPAPTERPESAKARPAEAPLQPAPDQPAQDKPALGPATFQPKPPQVAAQPAPAVAKPPAPPRPKTKTAEIEALLSQLGAKAQHLDDTDPNIPTILLDRSVLIDAMRRLKFEFRFEHLACLTAIDVKENFELVYNLWSYSRNKPLEVKVRVPRADATVPSLTSLWIGANWLEREEWDLMGVKFDGHPNMKRMFLPESWQGHPLRKDYDLKKEQYVALNDDGEDVAYPEPREGAW